MANVTIGRVATAKAALIALACLLAAALTTDATAQTADSFYRSKPLTIVVGSSAGGTFDLFGRLVARHMAKHMPGHRNIIVQNMVGAGGLSQANYLYNVSLKDGSVIGVVQRQLIVQPLLDSTGVQYDALKFNWIGNPASEVTVLAAFSTSGFKTFDDLKQRQFIVSSTAPGNDGDVAARILNTIAGTKIKVISGYAGLSEMLLAVERGEADGVNAASYGSFAATKPDWLRDNKINIIMQYAHTPSPDLPNVPTIDQFVPDEANRRLFDYFIAPAQLAYPFAAPPGVPDDRIAVLRQAFNETVADPDFIADAVRQGVHPSLTKGEDMNPIIAKVYALPVATLKQLREMGGKSAAPTVAMLQ